MRMVLFYGAVGAYGAEAGSRQKRPALKIERARVEVADRLSAMSVPGSGAIGGDGVVLSTTLSRSGVREAFRPRTMLPKVPRPPEVSFEPASLEEEISRAPVF